MLVLEMNHEKMKTNFINGVSNKNCNVCITLLLENLILKYKCINLKLVAIRIKYSLNKFCLTNSVSFKPKYQLLNIKCTTIKLASSNIFPV